MIGNEARMADNKKYYYLKLKEDFFESDEAVILESMPDGYIYSNILSSEKSTKNLRKGASDESWTFWSV